MKRARAPGPPRLSSSFTLNSGRINSCTVEGPFRRGRTHPRARYSLCRDRHAGVRLVAPGSGQGPAQELAALAAGEALDQPPGAGHLEGGQAGPTPGLQFGRPLCVDLIRGPSFTDPVNLQVGVPQPGTGPARRREPGRVLPCPCHRTYQLGPSSDALCTPCGL